MRRMTGVEGRKMESTDTIEGVMVCWQGGRSRACGDMRKGLICFPHKMYTKIQT